MERENQKNQTSGPMKKLIFSAFAASLMTTPALAADGLYFGLGLSATKSESASEFGGTASEGTAPTIGATVGYAWPKSYGSLAIEADLDLPINSELDFNGTTCSNFAVAPYYCEHKGTLRLRGVMTRNYDNFNGFASLGVGAMTGEGATSPFTTDRGVNVGLTASLGVEKGSFRYELIYDKLNQTRTEPDGYTPEFEAVSFKMTYFFK